MADPNSKNGHIDIPHDIAEALMKVNLSGYQYRIIWCIFRKTYGWHKSTDKISLMQFEKMTGLKRKYICRAIENLEDKNMIIVDRNSYVNTHKFNADYNTWKFKTSPKIGTSQNRVKPVPKKGHKPVPKKGHTKEKKETIQKKEYAEFVTMTEKEYQNLVSQYGEHNTRLMIKKLDNYKGANGKKYKSDYRAILSWVADEVLKKGRGDGSYKA